MSSLPRISVPNGDFNDDSVDGILSRVIARIRAHGLFVQGAYTSDWEAALRADRVRVRGHEIDVSATADEFAPALGQVVIHEYDAVTFTKIRGIGQPRREVVRKFVVGFSNNDVRRALKSEEAA